MLQLVDEYKAKTVARFSDTFGIVAGCNQDLLVRLLWKRKKSVTQDGEQQEYCCPGLGFSAGTTLLNLTCWEMISCICWLNYILGFKPPSPLHSSHQLSAAVFNCYALLSCNLVFLLQDVFKIYLFDQAFVHLIPYQMWLDSLFYNVFVMHLGMFYCVKGVLQVWEIWVWNQCFKIIRVQRESSLKWAVKIG